MNILIFSWRDPKHPNAGGAEQVMHEHMKGWVEAGHEVTLFSSRFSGSLGEESLDGIKLIHRGDQYVGVKLAAFFYYLKNKNSFDLVVDQFHGIPFFTPLYVRKPKLAVLQEVAREVWFLSGFPWPVSWIIGVLGFITEPLVFLLYKKTPFLVGSQSAKDDLIKMGIPGVNINIIPHGVILPRSKILDQRSKIKTILFLGTLTKDKGIEDALKVFSILGNLGNYNFWVVGKGSEEYKNYLLALAKKLGIKDRVTFWGFVDESKKFQLLARAHVLINPSMREGWGLVNIEANSVATPVVAYRSPGLVDSVKDGKSGIICTENTAQDMADQVEKILGNKDKYASLQKSAISWSKKFSWEKSRKESLKFIEEIGNTNKEFHSQVYKKDLVYNKKSRFKKARKIIAILQHASKIPLKNLRLLDVGCTGGLISLYLSPYFKEVVGADIDETAINDAKKLGKKNLSFKLLNPDGSFPFEKESFDIVVANQIYEHVESSEILMKEISRIMKPNGFCFLGAGNRLVIKDAHYPNLLFVSWLPIWLANYYVRLFKFGRYYEPRLRTIWGIKKMLKDFDITDYTLKIIKEPEKFDADDVISPNSIVSKTPIFILRILYFLIPNYLLILRKGVEGG